MKCVLVSKELQYQKSVAIVFQLEICLTTRVAIFKMISYYRDNVSFCRAC